MWILENFPRVAEVPNASGNLAVHFAAAQGKCPVNKKVAFFYHTLSFAVKIADIQTRNHRVTVIPHIFLPEENTWSYTGRCSYHILKPILTLRKVEI